MFDLNGVRIKHGDTLATNLFHTKPLKVYEKDGKIYWETGEEITKQHHTDAFWYVVKSSESKKPKLFRIVDNHNNVVDGLTGLTLEKAEQQLCRQLNLDVDCYIQGQLPTPKGMGL